MGRAIANYAVNYALGAYLARTYGGAELFSEIVQSGSAGIGAIEAALAAAGHEVTFGEVLADWGTAAAVGQHRSPEPAPLQPGDLEHLAHRGRGVPVGIDRSVQLPVRAAGADVGLRRTGFGEPIGAGGPYLHSLQSFNERRQPPHSNMMATLGRTSGRVSLRVTAAGDNRITVVVKE